MKKATALFAMSAALMSAAPAFAASDMFIKFDGVEGEDSATASIESWSFGTCNSGSCQTVTSPREASSGMASGKRTHHPSVVASQNTQSLRESPTRSSTGGTAVIESGEATKTNPAKASWDLATNKGARTAASGGVTVAVGVADQRADSRDAAQDERDCRRAGVVQPDRQCLQVREQRDRSSDRAGRVCDRCGADDPSQRLRTRLIEVGTTGVV